MENNNPQIESNQLGQDIKVIRNGAPSSAYVAASWAALLVGFGAYLIGLFNAEMELNEKGYYFCVIMFGLFSAVAVQKSVRDSIDNIPVSNVFYGLSWLCFATGVILLIVGLWNATLLLSEKGFYGVSFALSLFAAMSVQKNVRDGIAARKRTVDLTKE